MHGKLQFRQWSIIRYYHSVFVLSRPCLPPEAATTFQVILLLLLICLLSSMQPRSDLFCVLRDLLVRHLWNMLIYWLTTWLLYNHHRIELLPVIENATYLPPSEVDARGDAHRQCAVQPLTSCCLPTVDGRASEDSNSAQMNLSFIVHLIAVGGLHNNANDVNIFHKMHVLCKIASFLQMVCLGKRDSLTY